MTAAQAASLPNNAFVGTSSGGLALNPSYNPNAPGGPSGLTEVGGELVPIKTTPSVTGQFANPALATVGATPAELSQVAALQEQQAAQVSAYNSNPTISALRQALNTTSPYTNYQGQLVPTWTLKAKLAQAQQAAGFG